MTDVKTLWGVDSVQFAVATNKHMWLDTSDGVSLIDDASNIPANAWAYANTEDADYAKLQWSCRTESIDAGAPGAVTDARLYPNVQGSLLDLTSGEIAGLASVIPGTDQSATFDSGLRRGTNLSVYNGDWNLPGMMGQPSTKILQDTGSFWPDGVTPAADVDCVVEWWVEHRMFNESQPVAADVLPMHGMPNIKGIAELQNSVKLWTQYGGTATTFTISARLNLILYRDVATLDPKQFYLPGYKSSVTVT